MESSKRAPFLTEQNRWAITCTYQKVANLFVAEIGARCRVEAIYLVGSVLDRLEQLYDFEHDIDFHTIVRTPPTHTEVIPKRFIGIVDVCVTIRTTQFINT